MRFIVHDADGNILRTGQCSPNQLAAQAHAGETVIEDLMGDADDRYHRVEGGECVAAPPKPEIPRSFHYRRAKAYPSIGDQLDAIWKILNSGMANAPADALTIADAVKSVKKEFKK